MLEFTLLTLFAGLHHPDQLGHVHPAAAEAARDELV